MERITTTHRKTSFLALCKVIKNTEKMQNGKKYREMLDITGLQHKNNTKNGK